MNLALIGYDFPHIRTCDFMIALKKQHELTCVLAAPWRELNLPPHHLRVKREPPFHPKEIANLLNVPYYPVIHDSEDCRRIIREYDLDVALISGARILKKKTIDTFNYGIVNLHAGCLPGNRGLDTLQWGIYLDLPQGITAHFIDRRVDAGRLILREQIPLFNDDTLYDVEQRLYDRQVPMIKTVLETIKDKPLQNFDPIEDKTKPHKSIPPEIDRQIPLLFEKYLKRWAE